MTGADRGGTAIGLDVGSVRVGLAATDPTGTIASPVTTLPRRNAAAMWRRLRDEAANRGATRIVVGHLGPDPLRDDWDISEASRRLTEQPDRPAGTGPGRVQVSHAWADEVFPERRSGP